MADRDTRNGLGTEPAGPFPEHFAVTATHGLSTFRYVGGSIAACEKWATEWRARGWTVSEPWPFDGDNVFSLEDARKETA